MGAKAPKARLVFLSTLEPWQRALERADQIRYNTMERPDEMTAETVRFQPSDNIFAGKLGEVTDQKTPFRFTGAKLCDGKVEVVQYIQSGGFGRGWEGKDNVTGDKLFIKTFRSFSDRAPRKMNTEGLSEQDIARRKMKQMESQESAVRKEIEVLLHPLFMDVTEHPNVVANLLCYGNVFVPYTKQTGDMFYISTKDLCDGGELFNYICPTTPPYVRPFSQDSSRRLFRQICAGVAHMHNLGCYHRDLKLENLVLDGEFNAKIMDFGSVKFKDQMEEVVDNDGNVQTVTSTYTGIGTRGYKPKELVTGDYYDPAPYDVWSTGVMLFFVVAGDHIFNLLGGKNCFRLFEFMVTPNPDPRYAKYTKMLSKKNEIDAMTGAPPHTNFWAMFPDFAPSEELKDLINRFLDQDPARRISFAEVTEHEWFAVPDDPDKTKYFEEMRSRPTSMSRDQVMKVPAKSFQQAIEMLVRCSVAGLDNPEAFDVHADRVEFGRDELGESMYSVIVQEKAPMQYTYTCQWIAGDLGSWLEFIRSLKKQLTELLMPAK